MYDVSTLGSGDVIFFSTTAFYSSIETLVFAIKKHYYSRYMQYEDPMARYLAQMAGDKPVKLEVSSPKITPAVVQELAKTIATTGSSLNKAILSSGSVENRSNSFEPAVLADIPLEASSLKAIIDKFALAFAHSAARLGGQLTQLLGNEYFSHHLGQALTPEQMQRAGFKDALATAMTANPELKSQFVAALLYQWASQAEGLRYLSQLIADAAEKTQSAAVAQDTLAEKVMPVAPVVDGPQVPSPVEKTQTEEEELVEIGQNITQLFNFLQNGSSQGVQWLNSQSGTVMVGGRPIPFNCRAAGHEYALYLADMRIQISQEQKPPILLKKMSQALFASQTIRLGESLRAVLASLGIAAGPTAEVSPVPFAPLADAQSTATKLVQSEPLYSGGQEVATTAVEETLTEKDLGNIAQLIKDFAETMRLHLSTEQLRQEYELVVLGKKLRVTFNPLRLGGIRVGFSNASNPDITFSITVSDEPKLELLTLQAKQVTDKFGFSLTELLSAANAFFANPAERGAAESLTPQPLVETEDVVEQFKPFSSIEEVLERLSSAEGLKGMVQLLLDLIKSAEELQYKTKVRECKLWVGDVEFVCAYFLNNNGLGIVPLENNQKSFGFDMEELRAIAKGEIAITDPTDSTQKLIREIIVNACASTLGKEQVQKEQGPNPERAIADITRYVKGLNMGLSVEVDERVMHVPSNNPEGFREIDIIGPDEKLIATLRITVTDNTNGPNRFSEHTFANDEIYQRIMEGLI